MTNFWRSTGGDSGPDSTWQPLYRAGAMATAAAVLMYVLALLLFVVGGEAPESGGAAMLQYVADHRSAYISRQVLWLAPSLFLIPTFLALAIALRNLDKPLAAIAGTVSVTSWAVSLASPTSGDGSLAMVRLSDRFVDADTDAERASFVAGAEALIALNDVQVAIGVMQTFGILLISLLMLMGAFPAGLAWLGVVSALVGIVSEALRPILGWAYAVYGVLLFVWLIWVALALWKQSTASEPSAEPYASDTNRGLPVE